MKKILLIAGLLVFGVAIASIIADVNSIPPEKEKIILKSNKAKPVTFSHSTHIALDKMDCMQCHGSLDAKDPSFTCMGCHTVKGVKISREDTFHKGCVKCHEKPEYKDKKAPLDCAGCHKEEIAS